MRMQPRQELLDIWRAVARISWQKDKWVWGGRDRRNSISDAEQLLCLLAPATQVEVFSLDDPDRTGEDMLDALAPMGGATEIPRKLVSVLAEYFNEYTDESGTPVFSGGSYFGAVKDGSEPTEADLPRREIVMGLQRALRQTIASFREVLIGSGQVSDLDSPNQLFECGWSWGIVGGAPQVPIAEEEAQKIGEQRDGVAEQAPYLYFTVIALDAIEDLFSERTRILGLLNEEQQRLSRALQLRSDLTRSYWATVATFGDGRMWPLEDIPWRTTDGEESDYYTLQVTSLAVKGLTRQRGTDTELMRIATVLTELANRSRITRRPVRRDPQLSLHSPGFELILNDDDHEPKLVWTVNEFAPLLMQRTANIAGLISDARQRAALLEMADRVWDHLLKRRLKKAGGRDLWDEPAGAFPTLEPRQDDLPSWYFTERVVQELTATANVLDRPTQRTERLAAIAVELLSEAEHLFDRELMRGTASGSSLQDSVRTIRANLRRAREVLVDRPGTAAVLASNVLNLLDEIAAGGQKAGEVN